MKSFTRTFLGWVNPWTHMLIWCSAFLRPTGDRDTVISPEVSLTFGHFLTGMLATNSNGDLRLVLYRKWWVLVSFMSRRFRLKPSKGRMRKIPETAFETYFVVLVSEVSCGSNLAFSIYLSQHSPCGVYGTVHLVWGRVMLNRSKQRCIYPCGHRWDLLEFCVGFWWFFAGNSWINGFGPKVT